MGAIKTLLIGTLAVLGGCTVVVGGCTVGAVKAGVKTAGTIADTATQKHFDALYSKNPARAEAKYVEVATQCYSDKMKLKLGAKVPQNIIEERVNFDIYEIRVLKSGNQNNIKHLDSWRKHSDQKIIASLTDKHQKIAINRYLKKVNKGDLLETLCIAEGLMPEDKKRKTVRQANLRR